MTFSNGTGGLSVDKTHKSGWELSYGVKNGQLRVSYDLKPGELGRYGHQCIVSGDYAVGDDQAWMVPSLHFQAARIRIEPPHHWSVASRYGDTDGWPNIHPLPTERVSDELQTACIAFGSFNEERKVVGTTELRVFNPSNWPENR